MAISAYQWLPDLSQPISGYLIYLSLSVAVSSPQPISGYLSLSVAVSSISVYQWLTQPISGYLSLSVALIYPSPSMVA